MSVMWNVAQAILYIRKLQPIAHKHGYHITLGGGVLNKGTSKKDLDLFVLRKNNVEFSPAWEVLRDMYWASGMKTSHPLRDSPDYTPDALFHFEAAYKWGDEHGRRVDVFVQ